jgi:hypothetical protein
MKISANDLNGFKVWWSPPLFSIPINQNENSATMRGIQPLTLRKFIKEAAIKLRVKIKLHQSLIGLTL